MRRMYLSGPMSGIPEHNHPAFAQAASAWRDSGFDVVSPHEIAYPDNGEPGSISWGDYIRGDLAAMLTCDTIALLPGWHDSRGATLELYVATQIGMDVVFPPLASASQPPGAPAAGTGPVPPPPADAEPSSVVVGVAGGDGDCDNGSGATT